MEKKPKKPSIEIEEREYIIPLRKKWTRTQRYKKAKKAIRGIREFLARHMKVYDRDLNKIKLDIHLNEFVWARGIKKPPANVRVKVIKEGGIVRAELAELSEHTKFKKLRLEKREKISESSKKKKIETTEKEAIETEISEDKTEKEKETKEKKLAVIESGQQMAKNEAKQAKHQTKLSKEPKRQIRQSLKK